MGCAPSVSPTGQKHRRRVLLLGAGETGKSTIIKQAKLCFRGGLEAEERRKFSAALRSNTIEAMQALIEAVHMLDLGELPAEAQPIEELEEIDDPKVFTPELAKTISDLWKSELMQKAYKRRSEFWILDASPYYFDHAQRFAEPDFAPTTQDMLMARARTSGVIEQEFPVQDTTLCLIDVGGQRNERRKWLHLFDDVDGVMFVCSLIEYSQAMFEDLNQSRLHESVRLWKDIIRNPKFAQKPIFLVFNKSDLLEAQIKEEPITNFFPEYAGERSQRAVTHFLQSLFDSAWELARPGEKIRMTHTSAVHPADIEKLLGNVTRALT